MAPWLRPSGALRSVPRRRRGSSAGSTRTCTHRHMLACGRARGIDGGRLADDEHRLRWQQPRGRFRIDARIMARGSARYGHRRSAAAPRRRASSAGRRARDGSSSCPGRREISQAPRRNAAGAASGFSNRRTPISDARWRSHAGPRASRRSRASRPSRRRRWRRRSRRRARRVSARRLSPGSRRPWP